MARSGCGRSCGIRLSTGRQTSTAATPLRIPPPAACVGQKRNSSGSGRRNRRSSRRRAVLLLPMAQSKRNPPSSQKTQSLTERSRRPLRSVDGSRRVRTPRKKPPRSRPKTPISAHRQRHRSQWQRNRSGRDSRYSWRNAGAKPPDGKQNKKEPYRAARSRRRKPCVQMGAAAPCPTGNVQRRLLTSKNGLKPACPNRRGRTACRWNVTSSPLHRIPGRWLIQQRLWSPHRSRRPCCKAVPAPHGKQRCRQRGISKPRKRRRPPRRKHPRRQDGRCGPSCPPPEVLRRR